MSNLHVSIIPYCFKQSNLYTFHFKMVIFFTINFYGAYFYMETKCSKKSTAFPIPIRTAMMTLRWKSEQKNDPYLKGESAQRWPVLKVRSRTKKWPAFKRRVGKKMTLIQSKSRNKNYLYLKWESEQKKLVFKVRVGTKITCI